MPYNGGSITDSEFFKAACRWKSTTDIKTAAAWWNAFCEVIYREIYLNGSCRIPNIGKIVTEFRDKTTYTTKDINGKTISYEVPERLYPQFIPHDDFINDINMRGVTRAYRKRLAKRAPTKRDIMRDMRAKSISVAESETMKKSKQYQEDFQKLLREKSQNFRGTNVVEEESDE